MLGQPSKKILMKMKMLFIGLKLANLHTYLFFHLLFFTNSYVLKNLFHSLKTDFFIGILALIIILMFLVVSLLSIINMLTKRFWLTKKNLIITYFLKLIKSQ